MRRDRERIKHLIRIIDDVRNYICPFIHCCPANNIGDATWRQIQELLEKQIPKKPVMKAMNGFDSEVASQLCCPDCGKPVINYWNRSIKPPHCMMCGKKLDWSEKT